jgi:hypothetical protein
LNASVEVVQVPTFGIIAEGITDHPVIENIITGYFEGQGNEIIVNPVEPPSAFAPGGWGNVFESLKRKDHEGALQWNNYLVIQIDTDHQEDPGFDVPRREGGKELTVDQRIERVIEKLKSYIDPAFYEANKDRIIFAISVDEIECWLLPLLYSDKRAAKTTGCLDAADRGVRKRNMPGLAAGEKKFPAAYDFASRGYLKRKTLMKRRDANPSLGFFVQQLDELQKRIGANRPEPVPGPDPHPDGPTDKPTTG